MADTITPFTILNGLSLTGNAVIDFSGSGSPDIDEILVSAGTTGGVTWQTAGNFIHTSGVSRNILPIPAGSLSATTVAGATEIVWYLPYTIHSTISTKFSVISITSVTPTVTTYLAKVYACDPNTGGPTGAAVGDYGNTVITATTSTQFLSSSAVTLNPGTYWVGFVPSITASSALRNANSETVFTPKTMGVQTPTSATYTVGFTGSAPLPSTIGTVTEFTNSGGAIFVCPMLQIQ